MIGVDILNCDKEPIEIPGAIQAHGILLAIDKDYKICYCSENVAYHFSVSAHSILGKHINTIEKLLLPQGGSFIEQLIKIAHTPRGFAAVNPYPVLIKNIDYNLILAQSNDLYLLEFEPAGSDLDVDVQQVIGSNLSEILADANLGKLLERTAEQVKKIIAYDRVMVYKFHEDGHGEVVAESKTNDLLPLFGLHYPASDIPQQARELYKINLIRLIADVESEPSPILSYLEFNESPLDLTHSVTRAVSPIHIQYLKNMGVSSSFSISLLHKGELWGLIACHAYTPRFISYRQRDAAKLIGQVLSSALGLRQQEEDQQKRFRLKTAVDQLSRQLVRHNELAEALFNDRMTMLDAVDADGAVLVYEDKIYSTGETPDNDFIAQLLIWLDEQSEETVFSTDSLSKLFEPARSYKHLASGLLACRITKNTNNYLLWFRPETLKTVFWAGNPAKPFEVTETGITNISPRKSFETWSQEVDLTSIPWKIEDSYSALQLKEEVNYSINRKANAIRLMNEKLKEAYDELDSFSYTISHDLKTPLTTIKSYSQLLQRSATLQPKEEHWLNGILTGAQRMQGMIEEVLRYSRAGQSQAEYKAVKMEKMLEDLRQQLLVAYEDVNIEIKVGDAPDIFGDETMLQQVFSNLLGNAVKYSQKNLKPLVSIDGFLTENKVVYCISDNGVGIKEEEKDKVFELFKRSENASEFEGSGVGLAIVKRIMERHKGSISVESNLGLGSIFQVEFNRHL